jgi:hypothetical protein
MLFLWWRGEHSHFSHEMSSYFRISRVDYSLASRAQCLGPAGFTVRGHSEDEAVMFRLREQNLALRLSLWCFPCKNLMKHNIVVRT